VEVVASLFQGRTAAAQCGLFTCKSVPVIFEPPCNFDDILVWKFVCFSSRKSFHFIYARHAEMCMQHEYHIFKINLLILKPIA